LSTPVLDCLFDARSLYCFFKALASAATFQNGKEPKTW